MVIWRDTTNGNDAIRFATIYCQPIVVLGKRNIPSRTYAPTRLAEAVAAAVGIEDDGEIHAAQAEVVQREVPHTGAPGQRA